MHYVYPSIGGAMFSFGVGSVCDISLTMVLDALPHVSLHFPFYVRSQLLGLPSGLTIMAWVC